MRIFYPSKRFIFQLLNCYLLLISYFSPVKAEPIKSAVSTENKLGFHVQIINYISNELETEVNILSIPLGRRLNMIENGQLDLLVGLRKTPEREKQFIFIEPSYTIGKPVSAYYVNSKKNLIKTTKQTRLIAVVNNSSYIKDYSFPFDYKVIEVVSLTQVISMLDKGRVDAFIYGQKAANIELETRGLNYIKPSKDILPLNSNKIPSYIVISKLSSLKNDINKLSQISKRLREYKYRELHDLYYKIGDN